MNKIDIIQFGDYSEDMSREEKQAVILAAAERVFSRYGPAKTSVADIAREAAMSSAHIYNFFPSKDAVFDAVGTQRMEALKQDILAQVGKVADPWDKIVLLFTVTASHLRENLPNEMDVLSYALTLKHKRPVFLTSLHDFLRRQLDIHLRQAADLAVFTRITPTTASTMFDCMALAVEPLQIVLVERSEHADRVAAQLALLRQAL